MHVATRYRVLLYAEGEERHADYGGPVVRKGIAAAEVDKVLESNGKLPLPELLRCRVRYFTDGMAIGCKAFVERVFNENRGLFGPKRKDGARPLRGLAGESPDQRLYNLRQLRKEVFG